ncbi:MAG: homocysteine methyltransferase [Desulfuromonas sp.]|nr:MAG: homocysteine methyltransferase [Desulfuromonas sp.]
MHRLFDQVLSEEPVILGEGALIERLRRDSDCELDPELVNSAFIYRQAQRQALETIYRQYLDIGREAGLPLLLSTATWRASRERIARAGYAGEDVNGDNYRFLDQLRRGYGDYAEQVLICGLLSCRGDAFNPQEALSVEEGRRFHSWQAEQLAASAADFILAATLPALSEATGLAQALAATGKPYVVSFVLRPAGTLLDGTPLQTAIATLDERATPAPLAYMANCTHASNFRSAMGHVDAECRKRMVGLFANTAVLSPEELDDAPEVISEEPQRFAADVASLKGDFGMQILGGCCGTDDRHIRALAAQLDDSR